MIRIEGYYYDGQSSRQHVAELELNNSAFTVHFDNTEYTEQTNAIFINKPLGKTARAINFANGSVFKTNDHAGFAQMASALPETVQGRSRVHKLESSYRYVGLTVLLMISLSWLFITSGVPYLAKKTAFALPLSTNIYLSEGVIEVLDKRLLSPSELEQTTQDRLHILFDKMLAQQNESFDFQLLFRNSPHIGANAFAFPSGAIVMTDALVKEANSDEELEAILAHEIAHVSQRHGLRHVIADSALVLLITTITGDAFSATSLAAGLPIFLTEASYSRDFEREADQLALEYLIRNNIKPAKFTDLLSRIAKESESKENSITSYLASHPSTEERVKMFAD